LAGHYSGSVGTMNLEISVFYISKVKIPKTLKLVKLTSKLKLVKLTSRLKLVKKSFTILTFSMVPLVATRVADASRLVTCTYVTVTCTLAVTPNHTLPPRGRN
jgi:hypothetical protein